MILENIFWFWRYCCWPKSSATLVRSFPTFECTVWL